MSLIRAALFDVDGTLIDSNDFHAEAWARTFAHFGRHIPAERVRPLIGMGGDNLLPELLPAEFIDAHREEMEDYRADLFGRDYIDRIRPFPQVRALFERVRAEGVEIVLASSGKAEEVAHHLKVIGCEDLVSATTSADDAEHSKPDPDIFAAALAKLPDVGADAAVVIGDSPYDMRAAKALGLATIGLRCGGFSNAVLTEAGCDALFDDPADLLARFGESVLARATGGRLT